jgi:NADPH-dependent glutamate synthase beta subunit-like oxidoreductase
MNIPRFLQLYKEGRLADAFESVIMDNPLPASTGRVCQHPCESRCRRQAVDEPINMREVHRVIADSILLSDRFDEMAAKIVAKRLPATGKRIAVVGAGPAGLTASFYLALLGHEVVVHESHGEPGGMLRFALPEYRLPRNVVDREIEIIRRLGVKFILNSRIGADIALSDLEDSSTRCSCHSAPGRKRRSASPATIRLAYSARCISSKARPTISGRISVSGSSSSGAATPPSTAHARRFAKGPPRP